MGGAMIIIDAIAVLCLLALFSSIGCEGDMKGCWFCALDRWVGK